MALNQPPPVPPSWRLRPGDPTPGTNSMWQVWSDTNSLYTWVYKQQYGAMQLFDYVAGGIG